MKSKIYLLIMREENGDERLVCVSKDMGVCFRRLKTLDFDEVKKTFDRYDVKIHPGYVNICDKIKNRTYRIVTREVDCENDVCVIYQKNGKKKNLYAVSGSVDEAEEYIRGFSWECYLVGKGINKWAYDIKNKRNSPNDNKTELFIIEKVNIE